MTTEGVYTVGEVAEQFGVTVRTLHHYDQIGLLRPSQRSGAGYRQYTSADIQRLAHIVVYRRLEFSLEQIAALLDSDEADVEAHLRRQRAAVTGRLTALQELVGAIDHALENVMTNAPMTNEDIRELFGDNFADEYPAEAQRRWGDTDAWKQSQQRMANYGRAEWEQFKADTDRAHEQLLAALRTGAAPTSPRAMEAAEAHRVAIDTWCYDCDHDLHRNLAAMYLADPAFTATYEQMAAGLTQFVHDAVNANADRQDG